MSYIFEINARFLREVANKWPSDPAKATQLSIIEEGGTQMVRMAHLALVGSFSVNGVAELHTQLLKQGLFREFYDLWPQRFNNKTNGVTQRRWLRACNPALSGLITEAIGDGWVNRKPDVVVLRPEHMTLMADLKKSSVLLGMPPPAFVAEVVSPGGERSDNYRRDYEWKRQQYQELEIPEYWNIDRHRQLVTVLNLKDGLYTETVYRDTESVVSEVFPRLSLSARQILCAGDV